MGNYTSARNVENILNEKLTNKAMKTTQCKCGKSKVSFQCVGEGLWSATCDNCKIEVDREIGAQIYICNNCGSIVDFSDYYMMVH